jgi:S-adenosylmethionine:tRNA ribosyltransferase-isomerase
MLLTDFDYELPEELIAQQPLERRDASRMLVLERRSQSWADSSFAKMPELLNPGDLVVLNNTRVFPARLTGFRRDARGRGAAVEVLLLRRRSKTEAEWEVLAKPGRALRIGAELDFGDGRLQAVVTDLGDNGRRSIRFRSDSNFEDLIDEIGNTPLPPYIKRSPGQRVNEGRYQTVFASRRGAIAAPTAGLHFTGEIMDALSARGIGTVEITHHVGYATFQPVRELEIERHRIESEEFEITEEAANSINKAKCAGHRVVAVGTTTVRALESAARIDGTIASRHGSTDLFIRPGYEFRTIDALLTNFHLPRSTLLVLVSAFAGLDLVLSAYRHAVAARYRFFSYGDCMLVV